MTAPELAAQFGQRMSRLAGDQIARPKAELLMHDRAVLCGGNADRQSGRGWLPLPGPCAH